jgi:hypothetical protein
MPTFSDGVPDAGQDASQNEYRRQVAHEGGQRRDSNPDEGSESRKVAGPHPDEPSDRGGSAGPPGD